MTQTPLTFDELMQASVERCNSGVFNGRLLNDWNPAEWSNAMAGEVGEACNVTKKMLRGDANQEQLRIELGKEVADVMTYAVMIMARLGISPEVIRDKFNEVSDRVGSPIKL